MNQRWIRRLSTLAVLLALVVVMLGAYTRLTDAGLGCPDWPGCYGHLVIQADAAQKTLMPLSEESRKAWTEMIHRYAAGSLALLIFSIGLGVLMARIRAIQLPWQVPLILVCLVIFQACLGMWTVTWKLLPLVVMSHLLGGVLIVALLCYYRLQMSSLKGEDLHLWRRCFSLGAVIVFLQIALGGWVSANYAGISCIGFPQCNGLWVPDLYFAKGFNLLSPVGANYQGGLLDNEARMSIQWIHRLGAGVTALYIVSLSLILLLNASSKSLKILSLLMMGLVVLQIILGITNVIYLLPLGIAVAHNAVAALLFALVLSGIYFTRRDQKYDRI